jgi:carboxymethylenebutenolidase
MSESGVAARDISVDTPAGPMRIHEARPDGPVRGAIVVIQEAFGVNAHIEDVTRRAAAAGYQAVAPDLFHRSGPGSIVPYGQFEKVMQFFTDVGDDTAVIADVDAALSHLHAEGFRDASIGIVGFCFGGRVTFLTATQRAIGAAVGFYGGGIVTGRFPQFPALIDRVPQLQTPWLGLFGDQDGSIPVDDVETLRTALQSAPVDTDIVRYQAAGHGFHCDQRDDYRAGDAADAWQRTLAWFDKHLQPA